MSNVIKLNKDEITPEELLKNLLDHKDQLESVTIVYKDKDGERVLGYSQQTLEDLVFTAKLLDSYVTKEMVEYELAGNSEDESDE